MLIHCYILCHNEQMIIEEAVSHYLKFCSKIFVVDNDSTDGTIDLLKSFPNVEVVTFSTPDGFDDLKNVWAKENFFKQYSREDGLRFCGEVPDYVITVDADEFLYKENIIKFLEIQKDKKVTVPAVCGFEMVSKSWPSNGGLVGKVRQGVRKKNMDKPVIFSVDFDPSFSPGCHPKGKRFEKMLSHPDFKTSKEDCFYLLHYKYVGERAAKKNPENFKRLSARNKKLGYGKHYLASSDAFYRQQSIYMENAVDVFDCKDKMRQSSEWSCSWINKSSLALSDNDKEHKYHIGNVDTLRDVGFSLKKHGSFLLAYDLLKLARLSRPKGPLITKAANELAEKINKNSPLCYTRSDNFLLIVTYQRSGSTLLQSILNNHPDFDIKGEVNNALLGIWSAYKSIKTSKIHVNTKKGSDVDWPYYSAESFEEEVFFAKSLQAFIDSCILVNGLKKDAFLSKNISYRGFKEVKYEEFGEDLHDFLDKVTSLIPNCKIVFNFRELEDVSKSAWNINKNKKNLIDSLKDFEERCVDYYSKNKKKCYLLNYDSYINDPSKLIDLFSFLEVELKASVVENFLNKKLSHGK